MWFLNKKSTPETVYVKLAGMDVRVDYKNIKNVYLKIDRTSGLVRISAPLAMGMDRIEAFIQQKQDWVERRQRKIKVQGFGLAPECVDGAQHMFLGQQYRLQVLEHNAAPCVKLHQNVMQLSVRVKTPLAKRQSILEKWYRQQLKGLIPELIEQYEPLMDVKVSEFGIKKMKTRWGTCNTRARRIWLSLALVEKPIKCLEYVLVHEMVHLLERSHNKRFYQLMGHYMPDWKLHEKKLTEV